MRNHVYESELLQSESTGIPVTVLNNSASGAFDELE